MLNPNHILVFGPSERHNLFRVRKKVYTRLNARWPGSVFFPEELRHLYCLPTTTAAVHKVILEDPRTIFIFLLLSEGPKEELADLTRLAWDLSHQPAPASVPFILRMFAFFQEVYYPRFVAFWKTGSTSAFPVEFIGRLVTSNIRLVSDEEIQRSLKCASNDDISRKALEVVDEVLILDSLLLGLRRSLDGTERHISYLS